MKSKSAESLLFAYRPDRSNEPSIEKAHRSAESDPSLSRRLEQQIEFDRQLGRAIGAITPPEGLRDRVCGSGQAAGQKRDQFTLHLAIAALCSVGTILVLVVLFAMDHSARFPGSESVSRMVSSANSMSVLELIPVSGKAGDLGDWFYMRGFESYKVPSTLAPSPAIGSRLFKHDGNKVAQVAIENHHALVYVFQADAFGVVLPDHGWHRMEVDEWEAAVRKDGPTCTLVAIKGEKSEMNDFLKTLEKP